MMSNIEIPVYLFTGFLGSGKTTFIQDLLEGDDFNAGERTLLLLCEEGEVELAATFVNEDDARVVLQSGQEELAFGHILAQRKDPVLKEYLSKRLDVTTRLLEELSGQSAEEGSSAYVRYGQLAKEKNLIEKELEKWE